MFARKRSGLELAMNDRPHLVIAGIALGRSRNGASSRPSHLSRCQNTPGEFHGSAMLGVSMPALAWLVPSAGADSRSITITSQPSRARKYALATPIRPDPITTTRIASAFLEHFVRADGQHRDHQDRDEEPGEPAVAFRDQADHPVYCCGDHRD